MPLAAVVVAVLVGLAFAFRGASPTPTESSPKTSAVESGAPAGDVDEALSSEVAVAPVASEARTTIAILRGSVGGDRVVLVSKFT